MSLVDDIRAGSSDAIKQLYQENAQDVYDFAKGITNDHETAMQATKSTLSKLVQQIQEGSEPANLHSEALKLAYDEACKIAMPSVQDIRSPYDEDTEEEPVPVVTPKKQRQEPAQSAPQKEEYYEERYEEEEYEEAPRAPRRGNTRAKAEERDVVRDSRGSRDARDARDARDVRDARGARDDRYDRDPRERAQAQRGNRPSDPRRNARQEYYEDDYNRRYDRYNDYEEDYEYDDYEGKPKHGAGFYVCLVINIFLVLILIWFLIGLLMNLGVLPDTLQSKLGYDWFNNTIYQLF